MKKPNSPIQFEDYGDIEIVEGTVAHTFPLHMHNAACYGAITEGMAEFYCKSKRLLKKGDTFFAPRGVPHTLATVNNAPYSYRTVCIKYSEPLFGGDAFLQSALAYMLGQADETLNIEKLARHMGYSRYYMVHRFKQKCGLSPYQFYTGLRMAKIKQGLHTGKPLLDLTYQYGFSHQSHLCNSFKKYMGLSPVQYKEAYCFYASAGENVARI